MGSLGEKKWFQFSAGVGRYWVSGPVAGLADRGREGSNVILDTAPFWAQ